MEANEHEPQNGHDHEPRNLHDHAATPRASAFLWGGVGLGVLLVIVLLTHGFGLLSHGTSPEEAPALVHRGARIFVPEHSALRQRLTVMAAQTRPVWDFEDVGDWWTRANADGISPIVAVPTTAGTGSEVGRAAVVTNEVTHTKKIVFHPCMMPKAAICDPALTVGMPPIITAGTGMDALAHCLEAYCGAFYHPLADGIAAEGVRLVKENLARAVKSRSELSEQIRDTLLHEIGHLEGLDEDDLRRRGME